MIRPEGAPENGEQDARVTITNPAIKVGSQVVFDLVPSGEELRMVAMNVDLATDQTEASPLAAALASLLKGVDSQPMVDVVTKKPRRAKKATKLVVVKAEPVETGDAHDEVPAEPTTALVEQQPALVEVPVEQVPESVIMPEGQHPAEVAEPAVEAASVSSRRGVIGHLNGRIGEVFVIGDGPSVKWPVEDVLVIGPVNPQLGDIVELTDNPNGRTMATVLASSPYVLATITNVGPKFGFAKLMELVDGLDVVFLTLTQATSLMEKGLKVGDRVAVQLLPPDNSDQRYLTRLRAASAQAVVEHQLTLVVGKDWRDVSWAGEIGEQLIPTTLPGHPGLDLPDNEPQDWVLATGDGVYGYISVGRLAENVWTYKVLAVERTGIHGIKRLEILSAEPIVPETTSTEELVEPIPVAINASGDSGNGHHEDAVVPTEVLAGAAVPA
jgi:hypothetical protein